MRSRRAERYPAFISDYQTLLQSAIDSVGPDPASAAKWVENLINGSNNEGWIHSILKDLLSGDDSIKAKFIHTLKRQIAKFLADEVAEDIYSLGGDEDDDLWQDENPGGPHGYIR